MKSKKKNKAFVDRKNTTGNNVARKVVAGCLEESLVKVGVRQCAGGLMEDESSGLETSRHARGNSHPSPLSLKMPRRVDNSVCSNSSPVDNSISLRVSYVLTLQGNQCRLNGSVFRKLGIEPGGVVFFSASSPMRKIFLEAFLSTSVPSSTVEVSSDLSYLLDKVSSVLMKPADLPFLSHLQSVMLSITLLGANLHQNEVVVDAGSSLQWKSLFRQRYCYSLMYPGMRTTIRNALGVIVIDVLEVKGGKEELRMENSISSVSCGILSSNTTVLVSSDSVRSSSSAEKSGSMDTEVKNTKLDASFSLSTLSTPSVFTHLLVVGLEGTGKTFTLHEEVRHHKEVGRSIFFLEVESIANAEEARISSCVALHELFERARCAAPSTIVVDDLHLICHESSSIVGSSWSMALLARGFVEELRLLRSSQLDVCVLASSSSLDVLQPILLSASAFGNCVKRLDIPSSLEQKVSCLRRCLSDVVGATSSLSFSTTVHEEGTCDSPGVCHLPVEDCQKVVQAVNGYTQQDFRRLVEHAVASCFQRTGHLHCSAEALIESSRHIHPSTLREFDISVPNVTWDDIGGSEHAKAVLREVVQFALGESKAIFRQYNLSPPRGVLLYGPPGCSKTMLAKALANESHLNFISVKGPEIFSKWVGDSEKAVRNIFARSRAAAPCVVFIDELDGMCGHRGQGGVSDRVISQFLTELDGLPSAVSEKDQSLIFVAATNRPDNIDGALLRPGRIDKLLHIGLPNALERQRIAEIQFRRMPISPDLSASYVATITEGYSGAEVVAVIKEAALRAVSISILAEHVTKEDILAASKKVQPRTRREDVEWYFNWRRK